MQTVKKRMVEVGASWSFMAPIYFDVTMCLFWLPIIFFGCAWCALFLPLERLELFTSTDFNILPPETGSKHCVYGFWPTTTE